MTQIGKEYAFALFELARETGNETAIYEALKQTDDIFRAEPAYVDFLSSPGIPAEERVQALAEAFPDYPEYALSFLQLLCENSRITSFHDCFIEYELLYQISHRTVTAEVYSAVPLTEDEKTRLKETLEKRTGQHVVTQYFQDTSLLGGMKVYLDGNVLDGSIKKRLNDVKEVIAK